jgi:thioredoxin reductase (NADPH)
MVHNRMTSVHDVQADDLQADDILARDIQDAIVVGAGPAGLTAAIYLGRFRRRCLVLEDGHARARWIPTSHNIPGFTAGVGGGEFLANLRAQALEFGATIRHAHASELRVQGELFSLDTDSGTLHSRYVLLATGVRDHLPSIDGAPEAVMRSVLRFCPICDAFEAIDKRIAVISDGPLGEREAGFLRHYSDQVTLLQLGGDLRAEAARAGGIECLSVSLSDIRIHEDGVTVTGENRERRFDVVYLALGCSSQNALARSLGAHFDHTGALVVTAHQETSVPRLYAAGDVVRGLNQVVVAAAESAIAATDIHNKLRGK